ncbi:MAG: helix-turn-helix domain-containing protein [Oscillospiraceae bacterium]|nr:helix-turn-helix domain-containing protein [Oscillospiraceae bacterium]
MELSKQIRKYRKELGFSQEVLAERVFVSRQTVSSWENDKSYPDVKSLLLLSEVFHVSLDILIKGDVEQMKQVIRQDDIKQMKRYSKIYVVLFVVGVVSVVPLVEWLGLWGLLPFGVIWTALMWVAFRLEKLKKENDVQTYREITAFLEGKTLDGTDKQVEQGKRIYQKILLAMGAGLLTLMICAVVGVVIALVQGLVK